MDLNGDAARVTTLPEAAAASPAVQEKPATQCPFVHEETYLGVNVEVNRCPFSHGSVGVGPFPGYIHGKHPEICAHGCRPDPKLDKYGREGETPLQTLIREALEYQERYHKEQGSAPQVKEARVKEILEEIKTTGSYTHTFDELQYGARLAWGNAPKCSNRKFWDSIRLLDARSAQTPQEMFTACLELLEKATLSCVTTANIVVFRAQTPGTADGPRVWNNQLIRYAGYRQADNSIMGDPAEADFTELLVKEFGWSPPEGGQWFDVLPLLLQSHPNSPPELFTLPSQYVIRVPIRHPEIPGIAELGLQWYAVPAVSNMELSVGGLTYTAAPFNGWYADTEIVRNLTEEHRLNVCPAVAKIMGLDTKNNASMWRDKTIVEITLAVMHSFREAGMGMVDHHTLMQNFFKWYNKEKDKQGFTPGNWKWIITPVSPTASRCYLELNKMTEYTLKPGYWYAPGWKHYWKELQKGSEVGKPKVTPALEGALAAPVVELTASAAGSMPVVALIYASVTGNTQQYAENVATLLSQTGALSVNILNTEEFDADSWMVLISRAKCVVLMSSTYGPGAPPSSANKFITWLQSGSGEAEEVLKGVPFCVLGFGSSSYPRFCAAADLFQSLFLSLGATSMLPVAKADALTGEEGVVWPWVQTLGEALAGDGILPSDALAHLCKSLPLSGSDEPPPFVPLFRLIHLSGDGLKAATDKSCHWASVVEVKELLQKTDGGASTKLIRFDIDKVPCGSYYAGDEVCIWGENSPEVVEAFARHLGLSPKQLDDMFLLQEIEEGDISTSRIRFPLPNTFRTILAKYCGLEDRISYAAITALASCAPKDALLNELASSYAKYADWSLEQLPRWRDLFQLFPSLVLQVPMATFLQLVPLIKPRYYSISSSSAATPGEVAITVGRLLYTRGNGETRQGFCSSYLTNLSVGDRVRFKLISQPAFRQPLNLLSPVIYIAAGTGIAPFKGFWEERLLRLQQAQALGPSMLLFGCRSKTTDMLYGDVLQDLEKAGAIDKLVLALSREPRVPKTYVQDAIRNVAGEVKPLVEHPRCHVYVCGSSNMAQEASHALAKVAGKETINQMVLEGRYHEDVFGINIVDRSAAMKSAKEKFAIKQLAMQPLKDILEQLEAGLDINAVDHMGSTLLHHAAKEGRPDVASVLLTKGASANIVNYLGLTPMAEAIKAGHTILAQVMAAQGGARVSSMHASFYPLHAAVMQEDEAAVQQLLAKGASANQLDYNMVAPLHIAVVLGNQAIASELLTHGSDPNLQNHLGMSSLQLALSSENKGMVDLLHKAGGGVKASSLTAAVNPGAGDMWSAETAATLKVAGITPEDVARVRASWSYVSGEAYPDTVRKNMEEFGVTLFMALFEVYPGLLAMFPFRDEEGKPILEELKVHGLKVVSTLGEVIMRLQNMEALARYLTDLIERHFKYGVELKHYEVVLSAVESNISKFLTGKDSEETRAAWKRVFGLVAVVATNCYEKQSARSQKA